MPVTQEQKKLTKNNFFLKLKHSLLKTRKSIGIELLNFFHNKKINNDFINKIEERLLAADVGLKTTKKIINSFTNHISYKALNNYDVLNNKLRNKLLSILSEIDKPLIIKHQIPHIILIVGVNGVGKTTTIGKLAYKYRMDGKSVMLAAGDTFRASATEQLQIWGKYNNIPVIAQHFGADPASVIFDAIQSAKAKKIDILIADTAGRLQNKICLMEELKKIVKVIQKMNQQAFYDIILILDANFGQNAINQVEIFHKAVNLTGIILTKIDGTAKGGVIFAIADQCKIPIYYIGTGENINDLCPFVANDFIEALFARDN